jgi:hypothetical protein
MSLQQINFSISSPEGTYSIPSIGVANQNIVNPPPSISISPSTVSINMVIESNVTIDEFLQAALYKITLNNPTDYDYFEGNIIYNVILPVKNTARTCTIYKPLLRKMTSFPSPNVTIIKDEKGNEISEVNEGNKLSYKLEFSISFSDRKDIYDLRFPRYPDYCQKAVVSYFNVSLLFTRSLRSSIDNKLRQRSKIMKNDCQSEIYINGQTLIDGSDVGQMTFDVINNNQRRYYEKDCPKMVNVFIGNKEFLLTKVDDLWKKLDLDIDLLSFYDQVIIYGMLRYILSKLLYGNFSINYLRREYYKRFLMDLEKSEFCNFLDFFTSLPYSNFYKYFI